MFQSHQASLCSPDTLLTFPARASVLTCPLLSLFQEPFILSPTKIPKHAQLREAIVCLHIHVQQFTTPSRCPHPPESPLKQSLCLSGSFLVESESAVPTVSNDTKPLALYLLLVLLLVVVLLFFFFLLFFFSFLYFLFFSDRVSVCNPSCLGTRRSTCLCLHNAGTNG